MKVNSLEAEFMEMAYFLMANNGNDQYSEVITVRIISQQERLLLTAL